MLYEFLVYLSIFLGLFITIFYILGYHSRKHKTVKKILEKDLPFISILIPAYNEEKGIVKTIQSALAIDYPRNKMEILVIDDGSSDKTLSLAQKFKSKIVKVFSQKNTGKGGALNFGIKKSKGEFIFTMDADSMVVPESVRLQLEHFSSKKVMCVSPTVAVYKPKGILQRVQQIEYLLGVFLRETFASFNALHITPGAFSAYRKIFFEKHGGFQENNLTEDLEMALRIQSKGYIIENSKKSIVYTNAPNKFKALTIQRKRWYAGLFKNILDYKRIFSRKYGALGMIILPLAFISVFLSLALTAYLIVNFLVQLQKQFFLLNSINFDVLSLISFSRRALDTLIFKIFSDPIIWFSIVFFIFILLYLNLAKKVVIKHSGIIISLPIFLIFYIFLSSFWWAVSLIYVALDKKVGWR